MCDFATWVEFEVNGECSREFRVVGSGRVVTCPHLVTVLRND